MVLTEDSEAELIRRLSEDARENINMAGNIHSALSGVQIALINVKSNQQLRVKKKILIFQEAQRTLTDIANPEFTRLCKRVEDMIRYCLAQPFSQKSINEKVIGLLRDIDNKNVTLSHSMSTLWMWICDTVIYFYAMAQRRSSRSAMHFDTRLRLLNECLELIREIQDMMKLILIAVQQANPA